MEGNIPVPHMNIIYQTAKNRLTDTIKPRLTSIGTDCPRGLVIVESKMKLALREARLKEAILKNQYGTSMGNHCRTIEQELCISYHDVGTVDSVEPTTKAT